MTVHAVTWQEFLGFQSGTRDLGVRIPALFTPDVVHRIAAAAAIFCTLWILWELIPRILELVHGRSKNALLLEITPPKETQDMPSSTTELFNLLSALLSQRNLGDRLLLRRYSCSFEIASNKDGGIRYFVRVPIRLRMSLERNLKSYSPGVHLREVPDYLPENLSGRVVSRTLEFRLPKHFALPLGEHVDLKAHDPLAYLTGSMTGLLEGEVLAFQVVLSGLNGPGTFGIRREASRLRELVRRGNLESFPPKGGSTIALAATGRVLGTVLKLVTMPFVATAEVLANHKTEFPVRTEFVPSPVQLEAAALVSSKLARPLYAASVRALVIAGKPRIRVLENGLKASFSSFLHASGQSLKPALSLRIRPFENARLWRFRHRALGLRLVLSPSEAGGLWHFPFETDPQLQDLVRVRSRQLPVPLSLKRTDTSLDVSLGVSAFGSEKVPLGMTLEQRRKHLYVIGKTGMGKTTMLTNAIYQDMLSGKGLAVLDPHGDMLRELLRIIPENRKEDIVLFDPSDREYPIGLNILSPGIEFASKEDADEWITGTVISVFAKLTAKEHWGPRMEHILRSATLTALQTKDPSLYTLQRLLTDRKYQKKVSSTLKDPILRQFWQNEFALLGDMQLSSAVAPLTQRIGHFVTTKMSRHILLQENSTMRVSDIMNEGKILLVNLSKGDIGEDQSFFFGTVLTSLVWMAAYQRTRIPERDRRDFFLYVDEFQNFATQRFSEIASEGRKFRIGLTASHQNVAQAEDTNILKVVAGNAGTTVCFKAGPDDEKFMLPFMEPEVEKGDIVNLPPYRFYMKLTNDTSEQAFSGETVPLDIRGSDACKDEVVDMSRARYATPRHDVEAYLETLLDTGKTKKMPSPSVVNPFIAAEMDAP